MSGSDPSRYLKWLYEESGTGIPACVSPDLDAALAHPRLLIEGPAGSGKTAFLQDVAHLWVAGLLDARTYTLLFPIFIRLSELAASHGSPDPLIDFLNRRNRELHWGLHPGFFREKMAASFVLLDGLDEIPGLARLIEDTAAANPHSRFVVTTRPQSPPKILAGFHVVQVEPRPRLLQSTLTCRSSL